MEVEAAFAIAALLSMLAAASAFAPSPRRVRHGPGRPPNRRCAHQGAPDAAARHDEVVWDMIRFYGEDMIDPDSDRFYYLCRPHLGAREHVHFPMRDLAAAWGRVQGPRLCRAAPSRRTRRSRRRANEEALEGCW